MINYLVPGALERGIEKGIVGLIRQGKLSDQEIADVFDVDVTIVVRFREELNKGD